MSKSRSNFVYSLQSFISHDIDHLSELVKPWDLEIKKLNKGAEFNARVDQIVSQDFLIIKTDFSGVLEQKGAPPKGMRTLWLPVDDDQFFYWRKHNIDGKTIGFFPLGAELDAISKPGFKVYVISVPESILIRKAAKMHLDWLLLNQDGNKDHMELDPGKLERIRNIINQLFELNKFTLPPEIANNAFINIKNELLEQFILSCTKIPNTESIDISNRLRVFQKVREYLHFNATKEIHSEDLCKYSASSERTLQYVVKSYTGLTPIQFAKSIRLNLVREKLVKSDPIRTKINELAYSYEFWHTSQFASDYRQLFGELPSQTLKK